MGTQKDSQGHTEALPGVYRHHGGDGAQETLTHTHTELSASCSQHHSLTEGNCHFCVYPKCLHPPFLIHGMFVLIGQEEKLLALKLPIF